MLKPTLAFAVSVLVGLTFAGAVTLARAGQTGDDPPLDPSMPTFTGRWSIVTNRGTFTMQLQQTGRTVTGTYSPLNGRISGNVHESGKEIGSGLLFQWSDEKSSGTGHVFLAAPGTRLEGEYQLSSNRSVVAGTWTGTRVLKKLGKANTATAKNDIDVYDNPVQPRRVIGLMRADATATILDRHPDGWCKLKGVAAGADGWVAYDHITNCPEPK